jgi:hypothetical protein
MDVSIPRQELPTFGGFLSHGYHVNAKKIDVEVIRGLHADPSEIWHPQI